MVLRADPCHPTLDGHRFVEGMNGIDALLTTDQLVQSVSLDEYTLDSKVERIDFIKIDVEGAELLVLQGATTILSGNRLTMMLECKKNRTEVVGFLTDYGYDFFVWDMKSRLLRSVDFDQAVETGNVIVRRNGWSESER
jgi:hypothetical protein